MNWKGFFSRILLITVAFPALGILIFVPVLSHLPFNLVVAAATVIGAFEAVELFRAKGIPASRWFAPILSGTIPIAAYMEIASILPQGSLLLWTAAVFGILLLRGIVFQSAATLPSLLAFVSSSFFIFLYPGFFLSYLVRLSSFGFSSLAILFFLCSVFANDMAAYFAGSLWGGSTRLGLPASPRKSIVGFSAGIFASEVIVVIFHFAVPEFLPYGLPLKLLLGFVMGVLIITGDLIESGLKRSAGVKDSGIVIPGRGGILDSVDSMVLSAPFFYYFLIIMGSR
jgi:phosphatidate cytidylyltransferase